MSIRQTNKGFTLIEMVIAIAIFGLLSMMAYTGLTTVVRTQKGTESVMDRLNELQKAMMFMQRDIEQAVNRPVRDDTGFRSEAFIGGSTAGALLTLTRAGWKNPAKRVRSNLQRIAYEIIDADDGSKSLVRENYFHLDRSSVGEPTQFEILSNIETVEISFIGADGKSSNSWPAASFGLNEDAPPALPVAVEMLITLTDWGEMRRVFRVSDAI